MKFGIVGTGCMGSVYAGLLARAGHEVWALDTNRPHLDAIARKGLTVTGASGDHVATTIRVGERPVEAGPCEVWILATKAYDVDAVALVAKLLRPDDVVIAFQNGLGAGERVARHLPERHVLLGIAEGFGASLPEPGHVHHAGMRLIRLGELHGGLSERLLGLERVFREAGFEVAAFADVGRMVWEKLVCNVTVSGPCAAFDLSIAGLRASPDAWSVALGCMLEAWEAARRTGIAFSFDDPVAHVTEFAIGLGEASPSMRLDHLARRRSEVDAIHGAVVGRCDALGLEAPYNRTIAALLRERESRFERPCE